MRRSLVLLVVSAAACAAAPSAHADVQWLCRPDLGSDPCRGDLTTTHTASDGTSTVERVAAPKDPPVDCFYVYPTVSNQPTKNASKSPDPEVRSIATFQAQRFSERCRVYVPLYREVTAAGVTVAGQTRDTSGYDTAYADVREAWFEYLREDNRGRGVILIGHSQGSRILRALIRNEIDGDRRARDLLVSAVIPGANATVARGRVTGGDFAGVPACERPGQFGCVISYSTFNETPPDNARFGRTDTDPMGSALGLPTGPGLEVLCTDPTRLAGADGRLQTLVPTEPFAPGVIALLLLQTYGGPPPSADTPWLEPADHYTARCERSNGAHVLMLSPVGDARTLTPSPDATWGTHIVDLNIAMGNLLAVTAEQTRAWLADHRPLRISLRSRPIAIRTARVTATVTGPPRRRVLVVLRRGGRSFAVRTLRLDAAGRGRARFRVPRPGTFTATAREAS